MDVSCFTIFDLFCFGMYYPISRVMEGLVPVFVSRNCRLLAPQESDLVPVCLKSCSEMENNNKLRFRVLRSSSQLFYCLHHFSLSADE